MARKNNGKKNIKNERVVKREKEEDILKKLQNRIDSYDPKIDEQRIQQFDQLPITEGTIKGLKEASFVSMTEIQRKCIPMALKGEDIMGVAKTGSGKTLAFLIPTIESLARNGVTEYDGLVALIISPTRELAIQIFEVLVKIGKYNSFSAGLVVGGKDVKFEKERISRMNILVGTPGRISQHLNEAVGVETSNLLSLILDEADRCLDMGFRKQIDNILGHLPKKRQTLLFSATQSGSVNDLARLSLTNPRKIGVSSDQELSGTPDSLEQFYIQVPLEDKLDFLWSFLKAHLKSKILVFFSSLKQVQYTYETFRKLQPGISLLKLYGRHKQTSRLETTVKFSHAQHACLFATDIVARGLDFPAIDWVIQLDCPDDAATYIHRVGRAARFGRKGKSLLFLLPSEEEGMLKRLHQNRIEIKLMNVKLKSRKTIKPQLQSLCFQDPLIKNLGQRAFIAYFRSVYVQKNKDIFNIEDLSAEKFAKSLGLPGAPKIKIKGGADNKEKKNASRKLIALSKTNEEGEENNDDKKVRTKYERMFERKNQTVLSDHFLNLTGQKKTDETSGDEDEDFLTLRRQNHELKEEELPDLLIPASKRQAKKALSKKASIASKGNPTKLIFDDDGVSHPIYELEDEEDFRKKGDAGLQKENFVTKETKIMDVADINDKLVAKAKRQEKKRKRKEFERQLRENISEDELENEAIVTSVDIDRDMESSESEQEAPLNKKPRWFERTEEAYESPSSEVLEIEEPETLEDLEDLTARFLKK